MARFTQRLLDDILKQLTPESVAELKEDFDLKQSYQWSRAWKVTEVHGKANLPLVKAAREKIAAQKKKGEDVVNEVTQLLNEEVEQ